MITKIITATILYLLIDGIWLLFIAKGFYKASLEKGFHIYGNALYAIPAYVLLILGVVFFVIPKAGDKPLAALFYGAILGLIIYGVYDFTNLAVFKDYPLKLALIDFIWGGFVIGVVSYLTVVITNMIGR